MSGRIARAIVMLVLCGAPTSLLADTLCVDVVSDPSGSIQRVGVTLGNGTSYTDQAGHVCFDNVPPGNYQVTLRSSAAIRVCNVRTSVQNRC